MATGNKVPSESIEQALEKFESFYEDVFLKVLEFKIKIFKLADLGEVEDMIVCENIVDHLVGNVYIKFTSEEYAERCFVSL